MVVVGVVEEEEDVLHYCLGGNMLEEDVVVGMLYKDRHSRIHCTNITTLSYFFWFVID